jgi:hypothetical protein
MCLGCRKKRKKEEMVRFTKTPDGVSFVNEKKDLGGRGYYLCPDRLCFRLAQKKNKWLESLGSVESSILSNEGRLFQ